MNAITRVLILLVTLGFGQTVFAETCEDGSSVATLMNDGTMVVGCAVSTPEQSVSVVEEAEARQEEIPAAIELPESSEQPVQTVSNQSLPALQGAMVVDDQPVIEIKKFGRAPLLSKKQVAARLRGEQPLLNVERQVLAEQGLSAQEIEECNQEVLGQNKKFDVIHTGTKLGWTSGRGGKITGAFVYTGAPVLTLKCASGRVQQVVFDAGKESCGNWTNGNPQPEHFIHVPPKPMPQPEIPVVKTPEERAEESLIGLDYDLWLSAGGVHGNGSDTFFQYAAGGLYVYKDVENGRVEVGVAGHFGHSGGEAHPSGFRYEGNRFGVGPAVKYFNWDGWDARGSIFVGGVNETGISEDGLFKQARNALDLGVDAGINYYPRQLAGERWFPKTQGYAQLAWILSSNAHASYAGKAVDPGDYSKISFVGGVGVRQFIYDPESIPIRTFCGADWFAELPSSSALNVSCGITDRHEILWAWVGPSFDLIHGGKAGLWTVGVDSGNGIRYIRKEYRKGTFVEAVENGERAVAGEKLQSGTETYNPTTGVYHITP
jgi:hypothetical protein